MRGLVCYAVFRGLTYVRGDGAIYRAYGSARVVDSGSGKEIDVLLSFFRWVGGLYLGNGVGDHH